MEFKKYLQPFRFEERIIFGGFQEGIKRELVYTTEKEAIKVYKKIIENIKEDVDISELFDASEIQIFKNTGLLTKKESQKSRYSRNINLFSWLDVSNETEHYKYQKQIDEKKVLIVGLGGIGSNVLVNLVQMGVKKFILVDGDEVEISNLNRQAIYRLADVGKHKVEVCREYIDAMAENVDVEVISKFITSVSDLEDAVGDEKIDMLVGCGDKPLVKINKVYSDYAFKYNVPYAIGSYASTVVSAGIIDPRYTLTFDEVYEKLSGGPAMLNEIYDYDNITAATSPVATLCASLISLYIQFSFTNLVNCSYEYHITQIDYFNMRMSYFDIRK